jgi:hypothetical protein
MKKGALQFAEQQNSFVLICMGTFTQTKIDLQIQQVEDFI